MQIIDFRPSKCVKRDLATLEIHPVLGEVLEVCKGARRALPVFDSLVKHVGVFLAELRPRILNRRAYLYLNESAIFFDYDVNGTITVMRLVPMINDSGTRIESADRLHDAILYRYFRYHYAHTANVLHLRETHTFST